MADLKCRYMGLELRNPIIIASSPLTGTIEGLKKCEEAGAGAVVLKSIFEEQIEKTVADDIDRNYEFLHSDFASAYGTMTRDYYVDQYLKLVKDAKAALSIPVIASINCTDFSTWTEYIEAFHQAGADAIELNYYPIAADAFVEGKQIDKETVSFAKKIRACASLPVSIKIGYKYSSLSNIIYSLSIEKIDGLVLFNRFFRPDIDIDKIALKACSSVFSSKNEYTEALRWIALMSKDVKSDLCASTGIYDGETVIRMLLAGAAACQICSAAMMDLKVVGRMTEKLSSWMDEHSFSQIEDFKGRLADEKGSKDSFWERTQYMKTLIQGGFDR